MSELKARHVVDVYDDYAEQPCEEHSRVYLKSEADKVIADKDKQIEELKHQRDGAFGLANSGLTLEDLTKLARKEIDRQKCNRCLLRSVIAEMNATHFKALFYDAGSEALADEYNKQITIHYKWQKRWLELAKKFKPNSTDEERKTLIKAMIEEYFGFKFQPILAKAAIAFLQTTFLRISFKTLKNILNPAIKNVKIEIEIEDK